MCSQTGGPRPKTAQVSQAQMFSDLENFAGSDFGGAEGRVGPVPEPATAGLIVVGLSCLAAIGRRRPS